MTQNFTVDDATLEELTSLWYAARPIDDADWGTERQIAAENAFFDRVRELLATDQFEKLETYALKATVEEYLDEALRLIAELRPSDLDPEAHLAMNGDPVVIVSPRSAVA